MDLRNRATISRASRWSRGNDSVVHPTTPRDDYILELFHYLCILPCFHGGPQYTLKIEMDARAAVDQGNACQGGYQGRPTIPWTEFRGWGDKYNANIGRDRVINRMGTGATTKKKT